MKHNDLRYFIREGLHGISAHGFMSFAAICIIVACLIIIGSFSLLAMNVNHMISDLEQDNIVLAYVDENLSEAEAKSIGSTMNLVPNVRSAEFVTRTEALESFVARYENNSLFSELDETAFRHRYEIYLDDIALMEQTRNELLEIDGIVKVNAPTSVAEGFLTVRNIVSVVSFALIGILAIISLFIISNTIKLATFDRRDEIAIMKMVGATNSFIRWPFVFQGFFLGIIGAAIAFFIQWGLYALLARAMGTSGSLDVFGIVPFSNLWTGVAIIFGVGGFVIGVGGSVLTIRKYLKV